MRALDKLAGDGMHRLVLDLRGNPGGALDQAIRVANQFLPKGEMIVYTRGRIRIRTRTTARPMRQQFVTCR